MPLLPVPGVVQVKNSTVLPVASVTLRVLIVLNWLRGAVILAVLIAAADMNGVIGPPGWRVHQLRGDRAGTWSISVSGNWRLTFEVQQNEICDLDLEDYH